MIKKICFIGIFLFCVAYNGLFANTVLWSFNAPVLANKADGWNIVGYTNAATTSSTLNLSVQSNSNIRFDEYTNPYNPSVYKYVAIKLKNTTSQTTARFYWWGVNNSTAYYIEFAISSNDNTFKEYLINLGANSNWTAQTAGIRIIRFDLPSNVQAASLGKTISVDHIRLAASPPLQFPLAQPFGVNLAGAEFGDIPGNDYSYPTIAELDYFKSKGLKLFRLPFKWERIQPALNGNLDVAELAKMTTFVDAARARGLWVILDMHNYGRRKMGGNTIIIGSPTLSVAHVADVWEKLALVFRDYENIYGYGIMNEPHGMLTATPWFNIAQGIITKIRTVDAGTAIMVGGDDWSSASKWPTASDNLKDLIDASNNLIYEAHIYFDKNAGGLYTQSYDLEEATHNIGVVRVAPFVKWLNTNNLRGFVGEYGVPNNDSRWLVTLDNMLNYLKENGINGTYWAAGPRWNDYFLSVEPQNGNDRVQMSVLQNYTTANISSTSAVVDSRSMMHNWEFNRPVVTNAVEGWTIINYANPATSAGILNLQTVVANNHIKYDVTPLDPIQTTLHKYAVVRLKNTTNQTQARFYWHDHIAYSYADFSITANDTQYKEYVVDLSQISSWTSKNSIKIIRFDVPFGGIIGSINKTVHIDYVKLATSAPIVTSGSANVEFTHLQKLVPINANLTKGKTLKIVPNPVDSHVELVLNNGKGILKVKLLTLDGRLLFETRGTLDKINEQFSLKVSTFNSGTYLVNVEDNGIFYSQKLVKK
ncbi:MAG: cellulase family glycosylhydrolase [Pedobacter sp.]